VRYRTVRQNECHRERQPREDWLCDTEQQDKMNATESASQGMMEAAINLIQPELEENIKNRVDEIQSAVEQGTQGICMEHNVKTVEMPA
jgi:hypothetical protein